MAGSTERWRKLFGIGAGIAAISWAASGVAALLSPTGDASELGSPAFYAIETTHALGETGVLLALLGLWRGREWTGRSAGVALMVATAGTLLLALMTYLTVILQAAGVSPTALGELPSVVFLVSLFLTLIGFMWLGIVVIGVPSAPAALGWLLLAYPVLLGVLLFIYAAGLVLGALWAFVAWLALGRRDER